MDLSTKRFVPFADVRNALESVMDASGVRMNNLTQQLVDHQIPLAEWQSSMMDQIKLLTLQQLRLLVAAGHR